MERILTKKKNRYHDRDDPDYCGIRDIEVLLGRVGEKDYYEPILVKSAFKGNGNKNLSVKQYLYMVMLYLHDMINDHKATRKLKNNKNKFDWMENSIMHEYKFYFFKRYWRDLPYLCIES